MKWEIRRQIRCLLALGACCVAPADAAATPVAGHIAQVQSGLGAILALIAVLVVGLLGSALWRFRQKRHPFATSLEYHPVLQAIAWVVPVILVGVITIPAVLLIQDEAQIPKPDVTIQVTGHQWYWTYAYPKSGGFEFDSTALSDADAKQSGAPRLLATDNALIVPVNKVVEVVVTSSDGVHGWSVPTLGVTVDAIPGRLNHAWFKATKTGTYYGLCTGQCGAGVRMMPIMVKVVTLPQYRAWLEEAQEQYAGGRVMRLAAQ